MKRRFVLFACAVLATFACARPNPDSAGEQTKALVRQLVQEADASPGDLGWIDKWLAPDYQLTLNGTPMDRDAYRQMAMGFVSAFSEIQHEITQIVAEGDLVAVRVTLRMVHTGDFEGIAPTGRRVAVEEMVILQFRDGKVANEWTVADLAGLHQQLTTAPDGS